MPLSVLKNLGLILKEKRPRADESLMKMLTVGEYGVGGSGFGVTIRMKNVRQQYILP